MARDINIYGINHIQFLERVEYNFKKWNLSKEFGNKFLNKFGKDILTKDFVDLQNVLFDKKKLYTNEQFKILNISELIFYRSKSLSYSLFLLISELIEENSDFITNSNSIKFQENSTILKRDQLIEVFDWLLSIAKVGKSQSKEFNQNHLTKLNYKNKVEKAVKNSSLDKEGFKIISDNQILLEDWALKIKNSNFDFYYLEDSY